MGWLCAGVNLCHTHNLTGEALFYKWGAMRFNRGPSQFTMNDVVELKGIIQRDLSKANIMKKLARPTLSGLQSRSLGSTPVKSNARSALRGPMGTPMKPVVRPQDGFDLTRLEEKVVPVAGPSRVTFVGPSEDDQARKKRACELPTP